MTGARDDRSSATPDFIFETLTAYQKSHALRAAIELDLFSAIAAGDETVPGLASRCRTSERGLRMLCDYLVVLGLLTKSEGRYGLVDEAAVFLDRRSPDYQGDAARFLMSSSLTTAFASLTEAVRHGGAATDSQGTTAANHEVWIEFARGMGRRMEVTAGQLAELIAAEIGEVRSVLDVAAGHGMFGIRLARRNPQAEVCAVDWPAVLEVARENASTAGIAGRYKTRPGDATEIDLGAGYDLVLLANFLHHLGADDCRRMMRRARETLSPGGHAVTLEYVPNEDRISPPRPATFALVMLATTPNGDAYTFSEYEAMFSSAGFSSSRLHQLAGSLHQVIVSRK